MALFGPPDIESLRRKRKLGKLATALGHERYEIRRDAAVALAEIGDARVVEPLIAAMLKPDRMGVVGAAAEALAGIGDGRAVDPLVSLLPAGYAAEALGRLGDRRAVEPLAGALSEARSADDRFAVAGALEALGWAPTLDAAGARYHLWREREPTRLRWTKHVEACVAIGGPAVAPIIEWLRYMFDKGKASLMMYNADLLDRQMAEGAVPGIRALGRIGGPEAALFLESVCQDRTFAIPKRPTQQEVATLFCDDVFPDRLEVKSTAERLETKWGWAVERAHAANERLEKEASAALEQIAGR